MATEVLTKPKKSAAKKQAAPAEPDTKEAWRGFKPGLWQRDINVRWFLQNNYAPYDGDHSFLAPATDRTKRIWKKLEELFVEERKKSVLDVSLIPSSITAHAPGYIDRIHPIALGVPPALLVLAGHTHGGQIRGPGCTPYVPRGSGRFRSGFYDSALGRVYVSRGVGTSDIPARFLCPPELPIFTLRRSA